MTQTTDSGKLINTTSLPSTNNPNPRRRPATTQGGRHMIPPHLFADGHHALILKAITNPV